MTKTMVKRHYDWVSYFITILTHLLFYSRVERCHCLKMFGCKIYLIASAHKERKESTEEFTAKCRRYLFSEQKVTTQHSKTLIKKLLKLLQVVLSVKLKFIHIHSTMGEKRKTFSSEPILLTVTSYTSSMSFRC